MAGKLSPLTESPKDHERESIANNPFTNSTEDHQQAAEEEEGSCPSSACDSQTLIQATLSTGRGCTVPPCSTPTHQVTRKRCQAEEETSEGAAKLTVNDSLPLFQEILHLQRRRVTKCIT